LATFNGTLPLFGSTDSSTDVFTTLVAAGDTVRPGFETFEPATAPAPATWAMVLAGFAGLGFLRYRAGRATISMA